MEIWKDVKYYEGLYQVSNLGRVKRIVFINNKTIKKENKILKTRINKNNREQVSLYKNNKRKVWSVHRLVAIAFLKNPNNYPEVNHIDGNSKNNNLKNLEWCDKRYNCKHAYINNLSKLKKYNEAHKKSIIRNDGTIYDSAYSASKDLGVSVCSIRDNLKGRIKTCKGYFFRYIYD